MIVMMILPGHSNDGDNSDDGDDGDDASDDDDDDDDDNADEGDAEVSSKVQKPPIQVYVQSVPS